MSQRLLYQKLINKNQKKIMNEQEMKGEVYVENFCLFPLLNDNNLVVGVLEMSNNVLKQKDALKDLGYEDEYLMIVLGKFIQQKVNDLRKQQMMQIEINHNSMIQNLIIKLLDCTDRQYLDSVLQKEMKNIFGINKCRLFFMNHDDTFSFYKENKECRYDCQ